MKRILDTVHGYILVDELFIENIIDTKYFQRLRRIEQTSIRSVYPSARHDRFIHSLGVFHIGSMIVDHLKKEEKNWTITNAIAQKIYMSFKCACLLHDIAHAPFSHTFELYYGKKKDLAEILKNTIKEEQFSNDLEKTRNDNEPAEHEYLSADIAFSQYKEALNKLGADPTLVVRMITGTIYHEDNDSNKQIENCFITLLHGDVIDSDRLDYACRDVWASGYSTSSIDLRRLISAIHIDKHNDHFVVCFECNSLNEINGLLNVKDFQNRYVINHHTIVYEQWLLVKAAEEMAMEAFPGKTGFEALNKIITKDSLTNNVDVKGMTVSNISDDDLVFLIKQNKNNQHYKEWSSRKFSKFALWKSKDEFLYYFQELKDKSDLKNNEFEREIKKILKKKNFIKDDAEVLVKEINIKPRIDLSKLFLKVAQKVVPYTSIYPENFSNKNESFYYVYINKSEKTAKEINEYREKIISGIRVEILHLLGNKSKENDSNL